MAETQRRRARYAGGHGQDDPVISGPEDLVKAAERGDLSIDDVSLAEDCTFTFTITSSNPSEEAITGTIDTADIADEALAGPLEQATTPREILAHPWPQRTCPGSRV